MQIRPTRPGFEFAAVVGSTPVAAYENNVPNDGRTMDEQIRKQKSHATTVLHNGNHLGTLTRQRKITTRFTGIRINVYKADNNGFTTMLSILGQHSNVGC